MKNLNKLAFSVLVGAMALGMSAFTNANKPAQGSVYGSQAPANSNYTLRSNSYNPALCDPNAKRCVYIVTAAGASIVTGSSYTPDELEDFADASPALVTRSAQTGVYGG